MLSLHDIEALFDRRGGEQYAGEPVTQLEHALQTAALAEHEGADDELITASLLHDLGHLLQDLGETPTLRGVDDVHQYAALPFLRGLFPQLHGTRVEDDTAAAAQELSFVLKEEPHPQLEAALGFSIRNPPPIKLSSSSTPCSGS